jgi:hypothetical protein
MNESRKYSILLETITMLSHRFPTRLPCLIFVTVLQTTWLAPATAGVDQSFPTVQVTLAERFVFEMVGMGLTRQTLDYRWMPAPSFRTTRMPRDLGTLQSLQE